MIADVEGDVIHVVSLSTGKDSTATALLALEEVPRERLRWVTADTGNEHEEYERYLKYLEKELGIVIDVLRSEFTEQIARKREYVLNKWPEKGVPPHAVARAAKALVPTGNPYLDLCLWKGRFPSRRAQFCTEFLKTQPLVEYQLEIVESGLAAAVWSWQGVRIDESDSRRTRLQGTGACVKSFDVLGGGVYNFRPILRWTAQECIDAHALYGITPNPLYSQGMFRVGCMPCVNANKDEILEISKRFPHHIDRIEYWERSVAMTSKLEEASFFPNPHRDAHLNKRGIRNVVEWSKTQRGGVNLDFIRIMEEPKACSSNYGLCE